MALHSSAVITAVQRPALVFGLPISVFIGLAISGLILYAVLGLYVVPGMLALHFFCVLLTSDDINWHRKWWEGFRHTHPFTPNKGLRQKGVVTYLPLELKQHQKAKHGLS